RGRRRGALGAAPGRGPAGRREGTGRRGVHGEPLLRLGREAPPAARGAAEGREPAERRVHHPRQPPGGAEGGPRRLHEPHQLEGPGQARPVPRRVREPRRSDVGRERDEPRPARGSGHGRGPVASPGADLMRPGAALETPLAVGQELSALSKAGSGGASWGDARLSVEDRKSREPSDNSDGSSKIDLLLTAHKMREKQQGREASASVGSRLSDDVEPPVAGESVEDSSLTGDRRRTSLSHYYRSFHRNGGGAGPMDCS
ncbi:hypothetical protein THAOC_11842, partial [Thalassiosira oceanica]